MRDRSGPRAGPGAGIVRSAAWLLLAATWPFAAAAQSERIAASASGDAVMPHIEAVLTDPDVAGAIAAWGLSTADVRHDIAALSPLERVRLAYVLTRRWRGTGTQGEADLQAQFLVTMSLMRESTLFASIVSSGASRLR